MPDPRRLRNANFSLPERSRYRARPPSIGSRLGRQTEVTRCFMTLRVIGAGVGRTATFSLKFALEHLGLGPCYHMSEVFAGARRNIPLWLDVVNRKPDWDAI